MAGRYFAGRCIVYDSHGRVQWDSNWPDDRKAHAIGVSREVQRRTWFTRVRARIAQCWKRSR